jgi:bifunctional NMN adenylyltransferase/nudix hydrolase
MSNTAVFIGRFQPFHFGHLHIIKEAFANFSQLVIVVGSAERARTVKNPFSFSERKQLIIDNLSRYDFENNTNFTANTEVVAVEDNPYDEEAWQVNLERRVLSVAKYKNIQIVGHDKDASTYYLKMFPNWGLYSVGNYQNINATQLRHDYFVAQKASESDQLTQVSAGFLNKFKSHSAYPRLLEEFNFLVSYKESWQSSPYPPIFTTADSIVVCQNKILLIKRKFTPGRGLYALPGGFLDADEWIEQAILRELREETQIELSDNELKSYLVAIKVFDKPGRSQIGRVITHAGIFNLPLEFLPQITAADDAGEALWVDLHRVNEFRDKLHDDHYFLIKTCLDAIK